MTTRTVESESEVREKLKAFLVSLCYDIETLDLEQVHVCGWNASTDIGITLNVPIKGQQLPPSRDGVCPYCRGMVNHAA